MNKFLSPIALASAKKAKERHDAGEKIKGTGRMSNGSEVRPAILELFKTADSIEKLAHLRAMIVQGIACGSIDASERSSDRWEKAMWTKVIEFICDAKTPEAVSYVQNFVLKWPKTKAIADALEAICRAVYLTMPSPAERLKAEGITIEGVTT